MIDAREVKLGDEIADEGGKLWRVYGKCSEPTVFIEEIEPDDHGNKIKLIAGISGRLWQRMSLVQ